MDFKKIGDYWLLAMVDHYSKLLMFYMFRTKHSSNVEEFFEDCCELYGQPQILLTDNGGEFTSGSFEAMLHRRGIEIRHSLPYHPKTQGNGPLDFYYVILGTARHSL